MRRREFIRLFSGATLAWPISAHTQQSAEIKRIGVLMGTSDSDSDQKALVAIFTQALAELGWRDGANLHIEYRWAAGDTGRLPALAAELARLTSDACRAIANS